MLAFIPFEDPFLHILRLHQLYLGLGGGHLMEGVWALAWQLWGDEFLQEKTKGLGHRVEFKGQDF